MKKINPQLSSFARTIRKHYTKKESEIEKETLKDVKQQVLAYESAIMQLRLLLGVRIDEKLPEKDFLRIHTIQIWGLRILSLGLSIKKLILSGYYSESYILSRSLIESYLIVLYVGKNEKRFNKWLTMSKNPDAHWNMAEILKGLDKTAYPRMIKYLSNYTHSRFATIEMFIDKRMFLYPPFYKVSTAKVALYGGFQDLMFALLILEMFLLQFFDQKERYETTNKELWSIMELKKKV